MSDILEIEISSLTLVRVVIQIVLNMVQCSHVLLYPGWCLLSLYCSKLKIAKLAWVSAQIHCQCSVSENRVMLPADSTQINASDVAVSSSETSFVPFRGLFYTALWCGFIIVIAVYSLTTFQMFHILKINILVPFYNLFIVLWIVR